MKLIVLIRKRVEFTFGDHQSRQTTYSHQVPLLRLSSRCALLLALFPLSAQAQENSATPLQVNWKGPVECGSEKRLEEELVRLLGRQATSAAVTIVATASQLESGSYRLELELSGQVTGIRSLESKDCGEAIHASAVVLALAINPSALSAPPEPETQIPTPTPSPVVTAPPAANEPVLDEQMSSPHLSFIAGMQARLSGGIAPFPRFGVGVDAGAEWSYFTATLGGFFDPAPWQELEPEGQVRFGKSGARVDLCARFLELSRFSSRLCGGVTLTHVTTEVQGLQDSESPSAWVVSPTFGLSLVVAMLPSLRFVGSAGFEIPTTRPRFIVADEAGDPISVYQVNMGGTARLGLEFTLPFSPHQ